MCVCVCVCVCVFACVRVCVCVGVGGWGGGGVIRQCRVHPDMNGYALNTIQVLLVRARCINNVKQ